MRISVKKARLTQTKADAFVIVALEGRGGAAHLDRRLQAAVDEARELGFRGESGGAVWASAGRLPARRILVVGLGKKADLKLDGLRAALGHAATACAKAGLRSVAVDVPDLGLDPAAAAAAVTEGMMLAGFDPEEFKTEHDHKPRPLTRVTLCETNAARAGAMRKGMQRGSAMAEGAILVRRLVNQPGNVLTPTTMAKAAKDLAKEYANLRCSVWGPKEIEARKMGGLMGVGRGSAEPSQFIMLEYKPKERGRRDLPKIAFVGKGLTFDSGGISIKPAAGMEQMKFDMGGAGAVLGSFKILAELEPEVHVLGFIAAAENMPDGRAIKPGDMLRMMNGMTVEVNNTDAEGRLVLADALHYAKTQEPEFVVDAATLTGACMIALGDVAAGLMSEDDDLVDLIEQAAKDVDEAVWRLPLQEAHRKKMKGHVADLINTGPREGGALTAAAFLSYFTKGVRWAHLDIAGMVWTEKDRPYNRTGATGYGARLFARIAEMAAGDLA